MWAVEKILMPQYVLCNNVKCNVEKLFRANPEHNGISSNHILDIKDRAYAQEND